MTERLTGRHPNAVRVVVRLTEDAIDDLGRLQRSDPQAVKWCLKKILLLERDPEAGEPLVGGLIGFRKLVVGDRTWRVVWRVTHDTTGTCIVDVAEVWAAGARSESAVYSEMAARIAKLGDSPKAHALTQVLEQFAKVSQGLVALPEPEPEPEPAVPAWLVERLTGKGVALGDVLAMTLDEAVDRWEQIISARS